MQSFDDRPLRELAKEFPAIPRTFLIDGRDGPRWLTREGLAEIATFATGIGPSKLLLDGQAEIVRMAHEAGLTVTPYTFTTRGPDSGSATSAPRCDITFSSWTSTRCSPTTPIAFRAMPAPDSPPLNVLFLCTGDSARSITAEALTNHPSLGGKFRAFSAGSHPRGAVNRLALEQLQQHHISVQGLRSKSWDEFAQPNAPHLHFVFTVCDQAAAEVCPTWPGQPMTAHWGVPDPAAMTTSEEEQRRAFRDAFFILRRRIHLSACLPLDKLTRLALQERLDAIGRLPIDD